MKKSWVWLVAVVSAVLLGGALAVPLLVDQGWLKGWVTPQIERALRQKVTIDGSIDFALLPRPKVVARQVAIADQLQNLATLPVVEADLKLLPLLWGRLQPNTLRLIRPELLLSALSPLTVTAAAVLPSDGAAGEVGAAPTAVPLSSPKSGAPLALVIEQGRILLPAGGGQTLLLAPVDVALRVEDGAIAATGAATLGGVAFSLTGAVQWQRDRLLSSDVTLSLVGGGELHWSGQGDPRLQGGKLALKIDNLARLSPALPAIPAVMSSHFVPAPSGWVAQDLLVSLNDVDLQGSAQFEFADSPLVHLTLTGRVLDFDRLAGPKTGIIAPTKTPPVESPPPADNQAAPLPAPLFSLPGPNLDVSLAVDQLLWRGKIVQDAHISLRSEQGEIIITQAAVGLPGGGEVSLTGKISAGPTLSASFDGKSDDLRQLLSWGGLDLDDIPSDRLRVARMTGQVTATPDRIDVDPLRMKLDSSQIDARLKVRLGERPSLAVTFGLDSLNADAYWPTPAPIPPMPPPATASSPPAAPAAGSPAPAPPLDLVVKGHIDRVIWRGVALQDAAVDAAWSGDKLAINALTIGEMVGARLSFMGHIVKRDGLWVFDPGHLTVRSQDLAQTLRRFGVSLPSPLAVDLSADLGGSLTAPRTTLTAPSLDIGKTHLLAPRTTLTLAGQRADFEDFNAGLFGGQLQGQATLQRDSGAFTLHLHLIQAQVRQALLDVADIGLADGALQGELTLSSIGHTTGEIESHLAGNASLAVRDGQIRGFDLRAADNRLADQAGIGGLLALLQTGLTGGSTHFSSLAASAKIDRGVIACHDLTLVADGGGAQGEAIIDLPADTVEAHADFRFAHAADAPPLVMRLTGSLQAPRRFLDVKPLQQWLADHGLKTGKPKDVLKGLLQGLIR
jgi:hypothetical protein